MIGGNEIVEQNQQPSSLCSSAHHLVTLAYRRRMLEDPISSPMVNPD